MSAKAFYHKSPPVIPALKDVPPEIWSTIIQYAAESGSGIYEYEMTPSEHADFLRGEDKSLRRSFYANFRTRNYLSRVNKAWYAMTEPFLFEYIHLAHGRRVAPLCEAILRSKEAGSSGGRICSFGWWTKRLDIHIRDSGDSSYTTLKVVVSQLTDMIACFPKLRILSFYSTALGYDARPEILSLFDAVSAPKSLKVMHWHTPIYYPIPLLTDKWTAFLERHPNLQSIRGLNVVKTGSNDVSRSLRALWPLIPDSELSIKPISGTIKLTDCPLPNLSSFHLQRPWLPPDQLSQVRHISVLHLQWINSPTELSYDLVGHFPNIVEIDLELSTWELFTASYSIILITLKSLKTLGLSIYSPQISGKELRRLLQDVFPLFDQSSIKTIRFLIEKNVKALRRHSEILAAGTQRLASLGVALEDHQYQPLL